MLRLPHDAAPDRRLGRLRRVGTYLAELGASAAGLVNITELPPPTLPLGVPVISPHLFSRHISVTLSEKGRSINTITSPSPQQLQIHTMKSGYLVVNTE